MTAEAAPEHDDTARPTLQDLATLPPTVDLMTAAKILGIGRTVAYALVREGRWPTPVVRAGRLIRVPTAPLLKLLGTPESFGKLPCSADNGTAPFPNPAVALVARIDASKFTATRQRQWPTSFVLMLGSS